MIKFSSYQDTNTPWIGEIPTGWSYKSLKHIFTEKKSTKNPKLGCGSISFGKVIYKDDEKIPESTKESYQEVLDGEFLINPLNLNYDLKSLRIGLSRINVVVSQGYIVLNIKDGFVPEYYEYLLRKFDIEHMKSLGQGVRQTISYTHLKDEKLVIPPVDEQNLISRYLDKKTSQIDSLVNKIDKKIKLLKEQRASLINQYVIKGLDKNVEMKDSGVEWIGEIPKHWKVIKLNILSKNISNGTTATQIDESPYPVTRIETISGGIINSEKVGYIENDDSKLDSYLLNDGDLLLSHINSFEIVGQSAIYRKKNHGILYHGMNLLKIVVNRNLSTPEYLHNFLRSELARHFIRTVSKHAINQVSVSISNLSDLRITVPPIMEQMKITEQLEIDAGRIDRIIEVENKRISLLNEFRQSLISSVVTGKIRVTEDMA